MQEKVGRHFSSIEGSQAVLSQQLAYVRLEPRGACVSVPAVNGVFALKTAEHAACFLDRSLSGARSQGAAFGSIQTSALPCGRSIASMAPPMLRTAQKR